MYTITSTYNMSIRPDTTTANDRLGILPSGVQAQGEELRTLDNGDTWLYITNGWSVEGWVAVKLGTKTYCSLTGGPSTPPENPEEHPRSFILRDPAKNTESLYYKVQ